MKQTDDDRLTQINLGAKNGPDKDRIRIGEHVTIYRRGKRGTWTADFHFLNPEGRRQHRRKSLGTRHRRAAEQRGRLLEHKLERRDLGLEVAGPTLVDIAVEQFIKSKETDGRAKKTILKYRGELKVFARYLHEKHRITTLQSITAYHCDAYKTHRKEEDKLDTYALYNLMIILKTFLKWCRSRNLLMANPLAELRVAKARRRKHPAATPEQVNAVLARATGELFAMLATLAFTGLRVGELQALRPEDVDLKEGMIRVRRHDNWIPKTGSSERDVPVHRRLLAILCMLTKRNNYNYFFTAPASPQFPDGGHQVNPRTINEQFKKLSEHCGIPVGRKVQGLTLHSLRKFFKTFCLDSGVPKAMVDAWAGHEDDEDMDTFYYDTRSGTADQHAKSKAWMDRVPFGEPSEADLRQLKGELNEQVA